MDALQIENIGLIVSELLKDTGCALHYMGTEVTAEEASSPDGILPLFIFHARRLSEFLMSDGGDYWEGIGMEQDDEALFAVKATVAPGYQINLGFIGLMMAETVSFMKTKSPVPDVIEMSFLKNEIQERELEVLHEIEKSAKPHWDATPATSR